MDFLSADSLPWLEGAQQTLRVSLSAGRLPHSLLILSVPGLGAYRGESRNAFAQYSTSLLGDSSSRGTRWHTTLRSSTGYTVRHPAGL